MCFGGGGSAPNIVYSGPSDADIQRNQQQLAAYEDQMASQQAEFADTLQTQIDEAQAETARLQAEFDKELEIANAEAAAAGIQEANNAYTVTATQTEATGAQTTEVIKKKKKPNSTLKIGAGGVAQQAGSGLNIGV